jgi:hypothetical protein
VVQSGEPALIELWVSKLVPGLSTRTEMEKEEGKRRRKEVEKRYR